MPPALVRSDLRERIVQIATRLFAEQGFSSTSVRQLVEASDCTKPALYYYFGSKEALFREVVELHLKAVSDLMRDLTRAEGSVRETAHSVMARFIDYAEANPAVMRLLQRIEMQPEEGAPQFNMQATRELHLQMLSELIQRGIARGEIRDHAAPQDCALILAGTMSFQCEMAAAAGDWDRERIHRVLDLIFDGIAR